MIEVFKTNVTIHFSIDHHVNINRDASIFSVDPDAQTNAPPSFSMDSTASPEVKTMEGEGVGACSLARSTSGVKGCAEALRWD
jgi:hypothetical protein